MARQPHYLQQFQHRLEELNQQLENLQKQIDAGHSYLEPAAGNTRREITWLEGLLHG
ncbi:hypothetical protein [Cyanobium sp. WAJ14-Wanaka]|uniref:hypothetical protein n=1 Tax=Cyanobium sp. WAJ14-Wanaka TaxID=2823725 RepID=UPI0020CDA9F6|nr:hypothetical protein [Cyanobium sp. WAJ14-Wanaka]MCP9776216.1 hypothetical protein [Cyanobium sp. WAJ14-Wanaka]